MTIAETLLPVWLTELKRRLPPVRIEVQVLNSAQVLQEVQRGILQLGFVETPNVPVQLNALVVQEDELLVVVAPNHEWANRTSRIGLQELAETPWLSGSLAQVPARRCKRCWLGSSLSSRCRCLPATPRCALLLLPGRVLLP